MESRQQTKRVGDVGREDQNGKGRGWKKEKRKCKAGVEGRASLIKKKNEGNLGPANRRIRYGTGFDGV